MILIDTSTGRNDVFHCSLHMFQNKHKTFGSFFNNKFGAAGDISGGKDSGKLEDYGFRMHTYKYIITTSDLYGNGGISSTLACKFPCSSYNVALWGN